jgi:hypothetical protein
MFPKTLKVYFLEILFTLKLLLDDSTNEKLKFLFGAFQSFFDEVRIETPLLKLRLGFGSALIIEEFGLLLFLSF